jgi:hypothetical protein
MVFRLGRGRRTRWPARYPVRRARPAHRAGLVEIDHEEAVDGRLRRYYRLTESGAAALTTQVRRLRRNSDAAATRLRLAFGGAL